MTAMSPVPPPGMSTWLPSVRATSQHTNRPEVVSLDEAIARSRADRESPRHIQGTLALELVPDRILFGPQPTARAELPEPLKWGRRLAQVLAEVLVGLRQPTQLLRWTTPEVYAVIARRSLVARSRSGTSASGQSPRPRIAVRSVRVCEPADGVAELAVVLQDGPRVRAMALRLVGQDGRWRVEALHVG